MTWEGNLGTFMIQFATYFPILATLLVVVLLGAFKLWPSIDTLNALANLMNTKGGNILLLGFLSIFFFLIGIRFIYWTLERMIENKLTVDNAMIMLGVNFVTGTAFGGAFSSMLKTMTGESAPSMPGTKETTTSTITSVKTEPATPVASTTTTTSTTQGDPNATITP